MKFYSLQSLEMAIKKGMKLLYLAAPDPRCGNALVPWGSGPFTRF